MEEIDGIPHGGMNDDGIDFLVVEDSECSSQSESGQKFSELTAISPKRSPTRNVCNSKGFSDLQGIREISLSFSAEYHEEDKCCGKLEEVPSSDAALSQDRDKSMIHQTNLEFSNVQGIGLRKISSGLVLESDFTISDVIPRNSDSLQPFIEGSFNGACASLMDKVLTEVDALPAGINSKVAPRIPTECQERHKISEVTEPASNFKLEVNVTESLHGLAVSSLTQKSEITKIPSNSSSQVTDCVVASYLGCSSDQFSILDISESSSPMVSLEKITKYRSLENPEVKKNDRNADLLNHFQILAPSFPGQGKRIFKAKETERSVPESVTRGASLEKTLDIIEIDNILTEKGNSFGSQIGNDKIVGSHKVNVSLCPSEKDNRSLPSPKTPSGINPLSFQESTSRVISKGVENFSANHCYFLRSSSTLGDICDNVNFSASSLSSFERDPVHLKTYMNDIHPNNDLKGVVTPKMLPLHCIEDLRAPPEAPYLVRSSSDCSDDLTSSKFDGPYSVKKSRSSRAGIDNECKSVQYKSRNLVSKFSNTLANPVISRVGTDLAFEDKIDCKSQSRSTSESADGLHSVFQYRHIEIPDFGPSETLHQNKKSHMLEDGADFNGINPVLVSSSLVSETVNSHLEAEKCSTGFGGEVRPAELVNFGSENDRTSKGFNNPFSVMNSFVEDVSDILCHNDGCDKGKEPNNASYRFKSNLARSEYSDNCSETMPELEGFNIELPSASDRSFMCKFSDIPNVAIGQGSAFEQLCKSRFIFTPRCDASIVCKINDIPGGHQSLLPGMPEKMNLGCSSEDSDVHMKQFSVNSNHKLEDLCCSIGSQFDGHFGRSYSLSSSKRKFASKARNPPLTPISKFSHGRLPQKWSSSSERVGSKPELTCFRISENSITTEENGEYAEPVAPTCQASSRDSKLSTSRKALSDVTSLHQNISCMISNLRDNTERESLKSVNSESKSNFQNECDGNGKPMSYDYDKLIHSTRGGKNLKAAELICELSVKSKASAKASKRNSSHHKTEKGCKPTNIVSNMSSFIPLVQQKQQRTLPFKEKKGIKVKALEAAEVAKRLEGKKKLEREMRKAAAKLERERLDQEKAKQLELKQKAREEERRKKEADVAVRKRQRDEGERKYKDVKRRCIEVMRKIQGDGEKKLHAGKEKDLRLKTVDKKQKRKKQVTNELQAQKKLEKGGETTADQSAELQPRSSWFASGANKCVDNDSATEGLLKEKKIIAKGYANLDLPKETVQPIPATRLFQDLQSYEMSPYQDSDDEVMEDDIWRKKKYIPLWARRENLAEIVLSMQHLDPKEIFRRKCSFNLSQVLPSRFLWPLR